MRCLFETIDKTIKLTGVHKFVSHLHTRGLSQLGIPLWVMTSLREFDLHLPVLVMLEMNVHSVYSTGDAVI